MERLMAQESNNSWNPEQYYKVSRWGEGYFDIDRDGHMVVYPHSRQKGSSIKISEIIEELQSQKVQLPVILRFQDILRSQVDKLNNSFLNAIKKNNYAGTYTGVFPIKVNQMRKVVEEVVDAGAKFNYGLEAGSKAELLAVLVYNKNKDSLTVLNGCKDEDYLRLAMIGTKMGRRCVIVIENFHEVKEIIRLSKEMDVAPMIGLRARLSAKSRGKWAGSSGDKAKFGITISEILNTVELLKEHGMEQQLKLFHFHIGSQIADILVFKEAIAEAARIFAQLNKMGLQLQYFDVGGGLAVDYDGSQSKNDSSRNYRLTEYAADIVSTLQRICDEEGVAHPNIVSESGRAITAHHSCIITNVVDIIKPCCEEFDTRSTKGENHLVTQLRQTENLLNENNFQECFHEARSAREDSTNAFKLGVLSLTERAKAETIYGRIITKINTYLQENSFVPEELQNLDEQLACQYLCNFSVFQSAPDIWAIDQVLPIMPLDRLREEPLVTCTLADISCDSDGKIDHFIAEQGTGRSLKLHELDDKPYYLGLFLTGAYQDVMGDMHNLFGRLNEVHILDDRKKSGAFIIEKIIHGSTAADVLTFMQYDPKQMTDKVRENLLKQVSNGNINPHEAEEFTGFYEKCLQDTTYLKKGENHV